MLMSIIDLNGPDGEQPWCVTISIIHGRSLPSLPQFSYSFSPSCRLYFPFSLINLLVLLVFFFLFFFSIWERGNRSCALLILLSNSNHFTTSSWHGRKKFAPPSHRRAPPPTIIWVWLDQPIAGCGHQMIRRGGRDYPQGFEQSFFLF